MQIATFGFHQLKVYIHRICTHYLFGSWVTATKTNKCFRTDSGPVKATQICLGKYNIPLGPSMIKLPERFQQNWQKIFSKLSFGRLFTSNDHKELQKMVLLTILYKMSRLHINYRWNWNADSTFTKATKDVTPKEIRSKNT